MRGRGVGQGKADVGAKASCRLDLGWFGGVEVIFGVLL